MLLKYTAFYWGSAQQKEATFCFWLQISGSTRIGGCSKYCC